MEDSIEIIITQKEAPQRIIISGIVSKYEPNERFTSFTFNITDLRPSEKVIIPPTHQNISNGTLTLTFRGDVRHPSFWSLKAYKNNTYKLISFANNLDFLTFGQ